MRAHFCQRKSKTDDPAWFALRNTVFALGYRSILAKDAHTSFATAQVKAWRYFKKAFSVLTEILLPPSSLTAIQALALMVSIVSEHLEFHLTPIAGLLC